jgi:hypothetical protein
LCDAAIVWVARVVRASGREECYGAAYEPFLNLGRLARLHNQPREALRHFDTVRMAVAGQPVWIGPIELSGPTLTRSLSDPVLQHVLAEALIVDPLKTLLRARMFDDVDAFIAERRATAGTREGPFLWEANLIAQTCRARFDEAERIVTACARDAHLSMPVLVYRHAELLMAMQRERDACARLDPLTRQCLSKQSALGKYSVGCMLRVAALYERAGAHDTATAIARVCRDAAGALRDIPYVCEALEVQSRCTSSDVTREALLRERDDLRVRACWGAGASDATGGQTEAIAEIAAGCDELLRFAEDAHDDLQHHAPAAPASHATVVNAAP